MRAAEQLDRYDLLDLVAQDPGQATEVDVTLWHGYDRILDRPVALRVLAADDERASAVLGAAQAAAMVDDRRLLRVLDILTLPPHESDPARIAVVSEWANGRTLERVLEDRDHVPFSPAEALSLVAEVARALAAAQRQHVDHGRLRPSCVFVTDAGEVRVRGLSVDAAVFGVAGAARDEEERSADVDAMGSLLYLLTTGYWPGPAELGAPAAPRAGDVVLPPSQVRAGVPRAVDDVVARSVASAARPRGVARVTDAGAFATMVGATLDHLAPLTTTSPTATPLTPLRRTARWAVRIAIGVAAVAVTIALGWAGWQLATRPPDTPTSAEVDEGILTSSAIPLDQSTTTGIAQTFEIVGMRSYDPFGDDDGNDKPDRRNGRENEDLVATVNDVDPDTAWLTDEYRTPTPDDKAGVGLVLNLGEPRDVREVIANLVGKGSSVDIYVGDRVYRDPALWTPFATAHGAGARIDVRSPRPVTGQYVLLWFSRLPPMTSSPGLFQGGVRSVQVKG